MQNKESEKKFPELLFCPFCGREAELRHNKDGFSYIVCANDGCYARTDGHLNDESAIKAWNTRKPMDKIVERLEELKQKEYDTEERCNEEGFYNDVEDAYEDGESQGLFSGFVQAIRIIKKEGAI